MPKRLGEEGHPRREHEYKTRCLIGHLLDSGWAPRIAPYAALYYSGAKTLEWLKEHLPSADVEYICRMR